MTSSKDFYLLIDDVRDQFKVEKTARTYAEGILALKTLPITHLLIDHDLGEKKDGYDAVCWAIEHDCLPPHVFIVSANPVGRNRIGRALESTDYTFNISGWYDKT